MNANTLKAIRRHGESLLLAFPNAIEKDPVALCKKLRRIETGIHYSVTQHCNGDLDNQRMEGDELSAISRVSKLLGMDVQKIKVTGLFVNRDPRGYALKMNAEWTRRYNSGQWADRAGKMIHTDMGGYGILAPDLNS